MSRAAPPVAVVTVDSALAEARRRLSIAGVPEPRAEALGLLAWASGIRREALLAHGDDALDDGALDRFEGAVARRVGREPFAYIVGEREFFGLTFSVDRRVLIPRPESELLVELALEWLGTCTRESPLVVDVGTGSGALACAVAVHAPWCRVIGVDASSDALEVARVNQLSLVAPVAASCAGGAPQSLGMTSVVEEHHSGPAFLSSRSNARDPSVDHRDPQQDPAPAAVAEPGPLPGRWPAVSRWVPRCTSGRQGVAGRLEHGPRGQDGSLVALGTTLEESRLRPADPGAVTRLSLLQGDLLDPIAGPIDVVLANLPYLPSGSIDGLQPEVAIHEPRSALDGGRDGLDLVFRCLDQVGEKLAMDGLALFEVEPFQVDAVVRRAAWAACTVHRDLAGLDRVIALRRR